VYEYVKDASEIYRQSFETIRREAELTRFVGADKDLAIRLIHACGMVDLAEDIVISPGAVEAGRAALANHCSIVCDVTMVQRGIIRRNLSNDNPVLCNVGAEAAKANAKAFETTRSAGGLESLKGEIDGGIVVIGNAPTALFHLLEMIDQSVSPPALIIGCPVGFVGAVESKEALIAHTAGVAFISLRGRRGGSAIAAAAVNAIAAGLNG
jgi:precorrin-8X/cobalt-precorrin-8 methylmutase